MKTFWCDYCRAEIEFRRPSTEIVMVQAEHLFSEHGIDIDDPDRDHMPSETRKLRAVTSGDPR